MGAAASASGASKRMAAQDIANAIKGAFSSAQLAQAARVRDDPEMLRMIFDALQAGAKPTSAPGGGGGGSGGGGEAKRVSFTASTKPGGGPTTEVKQAKQAAVGGGKKPAPPSDDWLCEKCGEAKDDNKKSFCLKCASWGGFGSVQVLRWVGGRAGRCVPGTRVCSCRARVVRVRSRSLHSAATCANPPTTPGPGCTYAADPLTR